MVINHRKPCSPACCLNEQMSKQLEVGRMGLWELLDVGTARQCAASRVLSQRRDLVTALEKDFGRISLEKLGAFFYRSSLMNVMYFKSMFWPVMIKKLFLN